MSIEFNEKRIKYSPIFTHEDMNQLEQINKIINPQKAFSKRKMIDSFKFDLIYTNAKLEGNAYTKREAGIFLSTKIPQGNHNITDAIMLKNIQECYDYITNNSVSITLENIKKIHKILSRGLLEKIEQEGEIRSSYVELEGVGIRYIPLQNRDELEMKLHFVLSEYNNIDNPFEKAMYLHNSIMYLQCFEDCNKRVARFMMNISLKNDNKMFIVPSEENLSAYLNGLADFIELGKTDMLVDFVMVSYDEVKEKCLKYYQESEHIQNEIFEHEEENSVNFKL